MSSAQLSTPHRKCGVAALVALVAAGASGGWVVAAGGGESHAVRPVQAARKAHSGGAPRIIALGTVQDGGLPQAGCECAHCVAARHDPALRRHVASLAIHLPASGRVLLIDATPDLGPQLEVVHDFRHHPAAGVDRMPVDGVLLTHAHIGHYLGLAYFGFESLNSNGLPVYASRRMAAFLAANGPWSELVRRHNVALHEITPGEPLALGEGVAVTALQVPHRNELSDTLGFVVRGPRHTLLYVPDTDSWRAWPRPLPEVLEREKIDVAVLDGTFYAAGELPDRDIKKIGHPLMTETIALLREPVKTGRLRVYFTHLNHSNPALDATGTARRALEAAGFRVLEERQALDL
ncbi:MAG TPA: MBL fold metallo-hydrolase [Thermoanaerobaculia bacterium]|nr:MBL fold metallo-hydrolase [Thermoanaerobaculia bacterium]